MKKAIFIIHPSTIVRKGLNAIIRSFFNLDVLLLADTGEIAAYRGMQDAMVIVFAGMDSLPNPSAISALRDRNHLHLVGISGSSDEQQPIAFDHCISLEASDRDIHSLISNLMHTTRDEPEGGSDDGDLTVREKEVLSLVAMGHSNKEIAEKLFISIHTVISHRKNITEKLGIKSISGLTVYAILNKVIDADNLNTEQLI